MCLQREAFMASQDHPVETAHTKAFTLASLALARLSVTSCVVLFFRGFNELQVAVPGLVAPICL